MLSTGSLRAAAGALVFLLSFGVYLATLAPTLYFGDSGELIAMASYLGIPHPTGFPLYMLASKFSLSLPFANPAFRVNLLSALFSSMTAVLFFMLCARMCQDRLKQPLKYLLPALAAAVFVLSYTNWSQSVIARIYTMNGFFCAAALYLLFSFDEKPSAKNLCLLGLVTGLGAGLHLSFVVFSGLIWLYILIKHFRIALKHLPAAAGFALLGAAVYFYIFIRGASDTPLKWQDFFTPLSYLDYFTQKQYRVKMMGRDAEGYAAFFSYIFTVVLKDFSFAGFLAVAGGIVVTFINKTRTRFLLAALFVSNIIILALYGHYGDMKLAFRYLIPSFLIGALYILYLCLHIYSRIKNPRAAAVSAAAVPALIVLFSFPANYSENDRSLNFIARNYAYDLLASVPDNAGLFASGDNQIYPLAYVKFMENNLRGISVYDQIPTVFKDIVSLSSQSGSSSPVSNIIQAFKDEKGPLYSVTEAPSNLFYQLQDGFVLRLSEEPGGHSLYPFKLFSYKGILKDIPFYTFEEREVIGTYFLKLAEYYRLKGDIEKNLWCLEQAVKKGYDSVPVLGNAALRYGTNTALEAGAARSEELFLEALKLNPQSDAISFNLGSFYARAGDLSSAVEYFDRAAKLNPSNLNAQIYHARASEQLKAIREQQEEEQRRMREESLKRDAFHLAGLNFMKDNLFERAIEEFSKDIAQNPEIDRGYFHVALAYSRINDLNKAIPFYEQALEKFPNNTSTLNNLAICYHGTGNKRKAKEMLERSLKVNPDQERVRKMLEELR